MGHLAGSGQEVLRGDGRAGLAKSAMRGSAKALPPAGFSKS